MRQITYVAIAFLLSYGIWAFTYWQLNPFNWSVLGRFCFLATFFLGVGLAVANAAKMRNADALSEWQDKRKNNV